MQWCRGLDGVVDPARIASEARRLGDPDLICLQEVAAGFPDLPGSTGEDQPELLMRHLPGYAGFFAGGVDLPAGDGRRGRFGNLVLSRLPVGRVLRHSLPWPGASVPTIPRVAVELVVDAPFGALRVVTTHLEYYSSDHRAAQVERLRELHAECGPRTSPPEGEGPFRPMPRPASAILCGDFNLPPSDPLHGRLTGRHAGQAPPFVDAWEALHPGQPHPPTFRVHDRGEAPAPYCCDYVFVTEDLAGRLRSIQVDGTNRASDHQPVMVELEA